MPERSKDWLAQAKRDLEVAQSVLKDGFYEWGCFISQQAAEKAVKGLFQALHGEAWGHSISKLLGQLPEEMKQSEYIMRAAKQLDKLYVPTRNPNMFDTGAPKDYYTIEDAQEAIADAEELIKYCLASIRETANIN